MTEHLRYRFKLNKARKNISRTKDKFRSLIAGAKKLNNKLLTAELEDEARHEITIAQAELAWARSRYWTSQASKWEVALPAQDETHWEDFEGTGFEGTGFEGHFLSLSGVSYVRNGVREESSRSRKLIFEWLTMLIGIIGAASGFIAVWYSK
jgi:hypothetical protein